MKNLNLILSALALVGVLVLGFVYSGLSEDVSVALNLGGQSSFSGPVNSQAGYQESGSTVIDTDGGLIMGSSGSSTLDGGDVRIGSLVEIGASSTLSAAATTSLSASNVCDDGLVSFDPTATTVGSTTLPDYTDLDDDCLDTVGDEVEVLFRNLSSATTTQIVAGASTTLVEPDGQNVVIGTNSWAWLRFIAADDQTLFVSVDELIDAD